MDRHGVSHEVRTFCLTWGGRTYTHARFALAGILAVTVAAVFIRAHAGNPWAQVGVTALLVAAIVGGAYTWQGQPLSDITADSSGLRFISTWGRRCIPWEEITYVHRVPRIRLLGVQLEIGLDVTAYSFYPSRRLLLTEAYIEAFDDLAVMIADRSAIPEYQRRVVQKSVDGRRNGDP